MIVNKLRGSSNNKSPQLKDTLKMFYNPHDNQPGERQVLAIPSINMQDQLNIFNKNLDLTNSSASQSMAITQNQFYIN